MNGTLTIGANSILADGGYTLTAKGAVSNAGTHSGAGKISLNGSSSQTLSGTGSYGNLELNNSSGASLNASTTVNGNLAINSGALDLNSQTVTGTATVSSGGTLKGTGTVTGAVTVNSGGTVSPGSSIGTITFNSAPMFSGTNLMEIDRNGGSRLADKIALSSGTLAYGGTFMVKNIGATLVSGDSFTLFTAGGFSGWFCTVTLPALASGLSWDTNKLATSGVLDVYSFTTNAVQTMSTFKNTAANLLIAKLLSKAASSRGTMALASVSASSAQGGAVAIKGSNITYTPPTSAFTGGDSFTCVLSDGHGSITATVVVTVMDPNNSTGNGSNLAIRVLDGGSGMLIDHRWHGGQRIINCNTRTDFSPNWQQFWEAHS